MEKIPQNLKIFRLAKNRATLAGFYVIGDFPRISPLVKNPDGKVSVRLQFTLLDDDIPTVNGNIQTTMVMPCQRCLENMEIPIHSKFNLAFVENEKAGENLGGAFELVIGGENEISTIDFLTDEILLEAPMIPRHQEKCTAPDFHYHPKNSPFAILEKFTT